MRCKHLFRFGDSDAGATAIEYALIVALIAMTCISAFAGLGGSNNASWQKTADQAANVMK